MVIVINTSPLSSLPDVEERAVRICFLWSTQPLGTKGHQQEGTEQHVLVPCSHPAVPQLL